MYRYAFGLEILLLGVRSSKPALIMSLNEILDGVKWILFFYKCKVFFVAETGSFIIVGLNWMVVKQKTGIITNFFVCTGS